ncbi:DNA phosphorothioation-associated putative methyltransferase [Paraburkholderia bryophila]|uniref:DNA phosphorothioation-associated putative methyltransferase n=1 Tax=Paraburkholderia bryophila TaxID=420952 RepID=A0A7Y9WCR0_9BURK|nr:DNA phosphorothioation-associated putative methyltransferase [Paraburkholderia bryophila]NYH17833.1 DNA phosphorothioation-associated putative methyltransferase [Paraburkholderia bryophila]
MKRARQQVGKVVVDDLYVHRDSIEHLDAPLRNRISALIATAPSHAREQANVIKVNCRVARISLLAYADFFEDPFPSLMESWTIADVEVRSTVYRSYAESLNPPILHRKELLLSSEHALRPAFEEITRSAEVLGLFDDTATIGFKANWLRHIASKGYQLVGTQFVPIGNDVTDLSEPSECTGTPVLRHLTALTRNVLSAPVQLLARHGLLPNDWTVFDYGCGKGDDVATLCQHRYVASGWDPFFSPDNRVEPADVVNLGFVLNVIEDEAERFEALKRAFSLAKKVMAVAVMLKTSNTSGTPYKDGVLTSRSTFQKYFLQEELRQYLAHALDEDVFLAGPGVAFVFRDKNLEQRFSTSRYRRRGLAKRLLSLPRTPKAPDNKEHIPRAPRAITEEARRTLALMWEAALDLGRIPERDEIQFVPAIEEYFGSVTKAARLLVRHFDINQLKVAAAARADDLCVFFAMQCFAKRAPYRSLEQRLRRDIKTFFGDYRSAQDAGMRLLLRASDSEELRAGCALAAELGMGWLDPERALHLPLSVVDRLPPVLRAYVGCGLLVYGNVGDAQLAKIHAFSGKLTLTEYEEFDTAPLPRLVKRAKINIRKQDYEVFEYGGRYEKPLLYFKSRYLNEEYSNYSEQEAFDRALERLEPFDAGAYGASASDLAERLELHRWLIDGFVLRRSDSIPSLDQPCGKRFRYRDLIECGETQHRLRMPNMPVRPETYNALHDLATTILDPVVEYFGPIRLTYGFSSRDLSRQIPSRIAPRLDQHAAYEFDGQGKMICPRGGAACDFIVDDEDMEEVARWIMANLPFDRLYYYGNDRPIHVSYAEAPEGLAYEMKAATNGRRLPRPFRSR